MGTLFLVATPIGNLEDMSPRAVRTLQAVSVIAAEDTRHSRKLLSHFQVRTRLVSYHEHNKTSALPALLAALATGDAALISDAGMPGINDPGFELVRAALEAGHTVSPVPGPSAPLAALAASGLPADSFLYLGYLPRRRSERRALLEKNAAQPHTLIFLETPHRLLPALEDLQAVLGDREIAVAREMTKLHEEFVRGTVSQALAHFREHAPRGEFTLVVSGFQGERISWDEARLSAEVRAGLGAGESASEIARRLAAASAWPKRRVYALVHRLAAPGKAPAMHSLEDRDEPG